MVLGIRHYKGKRSVTTCLYFDGKLVSFFTFYEIN